MDRFQQVEFVDLTSPEKKSSCSESYLSKSSECSPGEEINGEKHDGRIRGMDAVIVTVSGYDSITRTKLVNMIVHIGALNTGSLSKINTHVVCWKFEGRKYELAKRMRKKFISHSWFEDCFKAGVLLPEEPYLNKSGEGEAPLCWDDIKLQASHCKSLLKKSSKIKSIDTAIQADSSSGKDRVPSCRKQGLLDFRIRTLDADSSCPGWTPPICTIGSVSTEPLLPQTHARPGAGFVDTSPLVESSLDQVQQCVKDPGKIVRLSGSRDQQSIKYDANRMPCPMTPSGVDFQIGSPLPVSTSRDQPHRVGDESWRNACISSPYSTEDGQHTRQPCSTTHQSGSSRNYQDDKADYAQIRMRRRAEVEAPSVGLSEKYRRLMSPTSGKSVCVDEHVGSIGRRTSSRDQASPSTQHLVRSTRSAQVESNNQQLGLLYESLDRADASIEKVAASSSPSEDIACVICHTETKPTTEGLLDCGHRFCYPCIQKWADEATWKVSTCPLCKASFEFITIRELERSANEGSCTQVLEERVVLAGKQIRQGQKINLHCPTAERICITCESKDSPELLITCNRCGQRSCHTFCLDPPQPPGSPWFCSRCSHMRSRYATRENVMTRFLT